MTEDRVDRASRKISASADDLYRAFVEPVLLERWLPPAGMHGTVHECDPLEGGGYVMSLYHENAAPTGLTPPDPERYLRRYTQR